MLSALSVSSASFDILIAVCWYDYIPTAIYFAFVIGAGFIARAEATTTGGLLTSGRSLPAWVTGVAFASANLDTIEIMGMSANGAEYGMPTFHYFWIGATPVMAFLGLVMTLFYYDSEMRSVPELVPECYGTAAHLVNTPSFAPAQLFITGINLCLLGEIMNRLLGWPLRVGLIVTIVIVFSYIAMGGLSAAIYNEVLQFFVIVTALLPLTLIGLHRIGSWHGLTGKITEAANFAGTDPTQQLHSRPDNLIPGLGSNLPSVIGLVFGLGSMLSFGCWAANFVEVQRAMAPDPVPSAQSVPIIGTLVKMFVPFPVIIPGMVTGVMVVEVQQLKSGADTSYQYSGVVPHLTYDLLPNGLLGLAITGLLAPFITGMMVNISAFSTAWGAGIHQHYIKKNAGNVHYLMVGKFSTLTVSAIMILTTITAPSYSNLMDYLQTLFSISNAPLFAAFIIGMSWKWTTPYAGWIGLIGGTLGVLVINILIWTERSVMSGQGDVFLVVGVAFIVNVVATVLASVVTKPKPDPELKDFIYASTPKGKRTDLYLYELSWFRRPTPLGIIARALITALNSIFH